MIRLIFQGLSCFKGYARLFSTVYQHKIKTPRSFVRGILWCTIPIQKRTKYFFEGDFSSALLIVEIHHDTVIEQIDGVDKAIDDLFLKGDIRRVAVAELIEPE